MTTAPAAGARTSEITDRLTSGQCLKWDHDAFPGQLTSPSGRFVLWGSANTFALENQVRTPGNGSGSAAVWRMDLNARGRTASLCMRTGGNLVWRVDGRNRWASHTSGRGATARLLDSGSLVVRSSANRTLWSSRTTAVLMRIGDVLPSGRSLVNRHYRTGSAKLPRVSSRLQMTRSGDLVLRKGSKRVWHSDTHVRGSYLTLTPNGRAVVRNPAGRTLWRAPAVGRNAILSLRGKGKLTLDAGHHCWVRPRGAGDCYTG